MGLAKGSGLERVLGFGFRVQDVAEGSEACASGDSSG